MGKYETLTRDILSVFGSAAWNNEGIKAFPSNYIGTDAGDKYIRVHALPSGAGLNRSSVSGQVLIDVFTPAGKGPLEASIIADRLDAYLVGRSKRLSKGAIQFGQASSMQHIGIDKVNAALHLSQYAVPFNYFGD